MNKSDETVSDDSAKADLFNQHFFSIFTKEDCSNLDDLQNSLQVPPSVIDSVHFASLHVLLSELQLADLCISYHTHVYTTITSVCIN